MPVLSFEQKKAFHMATHEMLEDTQYKDIVAILHEMYKEKKIDKEALGYVLVSLFSVATEVRAKQLGMDMVDIRFTAEEIEKKRRENFFGGMFNSDS